MFINFKFLYNINMYNWFVYNRFNNNKKEECSICYINKNLKYFCKNHKSL